MSSPIPDDLAALDELLDRRGAIRGRFRTGPVTYPDDDYLYTARRWSLRDRWAAHRWFWYRVMWLGPGKGSGGRYGQDPVGPDFERMQSTAERGANGRAVVIAGELGKEYNDALVTEALDRLLDRLYGLRDPGPATESHEAA